jgi:hypothetical protein
MGPKEKNLNLGLGRSLAVLLLALMLVSAKSPAPQALTQKAERMPETVILSKEAKLGAVRFNHLKHATLQWSPDGERQIDCVQCHHVAQPLAQALKHPPHKTVWPPNRETTLTAELLARDPNVVVPKCTDCHARTDQKPKLLTEVPSLKDESTDAIVLTNQEALHRSCCGCHEQAAKMRPALDPWPPTSRKCVSCHKKTAA